MSFASESQEPVHLWFGLTYTSYIILQRSILQSMPIEWQRRFIACIEEVDAAVRGLPDMPDEYKVLCKSNGRKVDDPYMDYERGRRRVPLKIKESEPTNDQTA